MARKRFEPLTVPITSLAPGGLGVGAHDDRPVLVRGAPPGAVVQALPFARKDGALHARRLALLQPPPDAVPPRCALFGTCGGCVLQELPLGAQRQAKEDMVRALLGPTPGAVWLPTTGDDAAYGYRNKLDLSFGARRFQSQAERDAGLDNHGAWLGFHAPGRFDKVVDCPRCELASEGMNAVLAAARAQLLRSALPCWDSRAGLGFWRHLILRETLDGQALAAVYTAVPEDEAAAAAELEALAAALPPDTRVLWYVNPRSGDAAVGELRAVLRGPPTLTETLAGVRFQLSATAFFQTSTRGAEHLVAAVARALDLGGWVGRLLDLYCGTGALGLALAGQAAEVLGVELNAEAVADAQANAAANGLERVRYVAGAVEDVLPQTRPGDRAVVDPPRAGLHPRAAAWLAAQPLERLVYVACNPAALARDRQLLEAGGWRLERVQCVDLFPQTGHIEVVAAFGR